MILLSYFTFHHFVKSTKSVICFENEKETLLFFAVLGFCALC